MAAPLGSLAGFGARIRDLHEEQDDLIQEELRLVMNNSPSVRARKVAPGTKSNSHPRIRRRFNKYGSKPRLTPAYITNNQGVEVPNPDLTKVRGRYETQRKCEYIPKMALMKMAKDFGIEPYKSANDAEFRKGSKLWKAGTTADICKAMSTKYRSQKRRPINQMTAHRDESLQEVKQALEFVASSMKVRLVRNDGKEKSLLALSREIAKKLRQ